MAWLCPHCRTRFTEPQERCPHDKRKLVPDLSGQEIGDRYTLRELLGVGGMDSSVWMAWQTSTHRSVAIKILPPVEGDAAERFARGARIASNLNHPNITVVHDYGRTVKGELYLVMELLEGTTLYRALRKQPFGLDRTVHVVDQVLRALGHAHRRGVVHRDIKLSNLFLVPREDDPDFVKVLDFGIARFIEDPPESWSVDGDLPNNEITTTRQLCGTPQYMAPEQIGFGNIDHRADLYAVGVATFRILTGRFPFQGTAHEQFRHHLQSAPPSVREVRPDLDVPPEIDAWIQRAMEKKADKRFASAEEMRTALRQIRRRLGIAGAEMEDSSGTSAPISSRSAASWAGEAASRNTESFRPAEQPRRRGVIYVAIGALLLFAGIVAWLLRPVPPPTVVIRPAASNSTGAAAAASPAPDPPAARAATPDAGKPVAAAADAGAAPAAPVMKPVHITSRPDGAEVRFEDKVLGETPLDAEAPVGVHRLYLARDGYEDASIQVEVTADGESDVRSHAVLERASRPTAARAPATPRPPAAAAATPAASPPATAAATPTPAPAANPPADEPVARPARPAGQKQSGTVRMQLLDEDEARTFESGGRPAAPRTPTPTGEKPQVDLIE